MIANESDYYRAQFFVTLTAGTKVSPYTIIEKTSDLEINSPNELNVFIKELFRAFPGTKLETYLFNKYQSKKE